MSDPVVDWLKSIGASSKKIHYAHKRYAFICDYFGLINPGFSKCACKKILSKVREDILSGKEITRVSFMGHTFDIVGAKEKWDLDHIAFCRSKKFYTSQRWKNLRLQALAVSNKCKACGASPKQGAVLHVDHIMPRSIYPELALNLSNLQILCADCNLGKGNTITKKFE